MCDRFIELLRLSKTIAASPHKTRDISISKLKKYCELWSNGCQQCCTIGNGAFIPGAILKILSRTFNRWFLPDDRWPTNRLKRSNRRSECPLDCDGYLGHGKQLTSDIDRDLSTHIRCACFRHVHRQEPGDHIRGHFDRTSILARLVVLKMTGTLYAMTNTSPGHSAFSRFERARAEATRSQDRHHLLRE